MISVASRAVLGVQAMVGVAREVGEHRQHLVTFDSIRQGKLMLTHCAA